MKIKITFAFLALLFALTSCAPVATPMPTATSSPTSIPPTFTAIIPTPTLVSPQEPPACTFPLAQTTMEESEPEVYSFVEPRVTMAARFGFEIIEWLPDSERALVTRFVQDEAGNYSGMENIEIVIPETGKSQIYATRRGGPRHSPIWVQGLNAVIYPNIEILSYTRNNNMNIPPYEYQRQLWISEGDLEQTRLIESTQTSANGAFSFSVTSKPDGSQILYRSGVDRQLIWRKVKMGKLEVGQIISFDVSRWENEDNTLEIVYDMKWRPNTSQVFFYSYSSMTDRTLLMDLEIKSICTISFGEWVYFARWSPNGRFLAVITSRGPRISMHENYNLSVLDSATGRVYKLDSTKIGPPEMKNCCRHIVEDITWAPDNRHLALIGTADFSGTGTHVKHDRLYLFDFLTGEVNDLFPSYIPTSNRFGTSLAWSSDGSKILTTCPEGNLCLISVNRSGP